RRRSARTRCRPSRRSLAARGRALARPLAHCGRTRRRAREGPMTGKAMRLERVIDPAGVSVICALDHGMTSPTFLEPLADIAGRPAHAGARGGHVIMMSKGMIRIA